MKIYLAGPFFNNEQIALVAELEFALNEMGHELFSPRRDSGGPAKPIGEWTEEERELCFKSNVSGIQNCDVVVAITEYRGSELFAWEQWDDDFGHMEEHANGRFPRGKPIRVDMPDVGTVWEIGYANAIGKAVVAYNEDEKKDTGFNLMLMQCFGGTARGIYELKEMIE